MPSLPQSHGFTLIEIMVSVTIFSVVMTMSLGALLAMAESNRRVETMKSVINTLNFALDSMSRSIRTGTNYRCGSAGATPLSCASTPSTFLTYLSVQGTGGPGTPVQVSYCRGNGTSCSASGTAILRALDNGTFAPITSKEVVIETLDFYVVGAEGAPDTIQPKVTILLTGYVMVSGGGTSIAACGVTAQCSKFELQTSVTQRIYDQ